MTEKQRHLAYLAKAFDVADDVAAAMGDGGRLELLRRYGTWLKGLQEGDLQPLTEKQRHFVRVCESKEGAVTPYEEVWCEYLRAHRHLLHERVLESGLPVATDRDRSKQAFAGTGDSPVGERDAARATRLWHGEAGARLRDNRGEHLYREALELQGRYKPGGDVTYAQVHRAFERAAKSGCPMAQEWVRGQDDPRIESSTYFRVGATEMLAPVARDDGWDYSEDYRQLFGVPPP